MSISCDKIFLLVSRYSFLWPWPYLEIGHYQGHLCFIYYYIISFKISFAATSTYIVMIPCTCSIWFLIKNMFVHVIKSHYSYGIPYNSCLGIDLHGHCRLCIILYMIKYGLNWKMEDALCKRWFHDITEKGIVILVIN